MSFLVAPLLIEMAVNRLCRGIDGSLELKILKRTAEFAAAAGGVAAASGAPFQRPWLLPKRSKLFLEQSARERENAVGEYETVPKQSLMVVHIFSFIYAYLLRLGGRS